MSEAERLKVKTVRLDFSDLYFLNSSCLKHFASLIAVNKKAGPGRRVRLIFRTESSLSWQDRCLEALHYLDVDFVIIEGTRSDSSMAPTPGRRD
jgi:hypothetical protein